MNLSPEGRPAALPATAIFGASGFIGGHLWRAFQRADPRTIGVARTPRDGWLTLDLGDPDGRSLALSRRGITHAILACGVTGVRACEEDPEGTRAINVVGTAEIARQLNGEGIRVIVFSSDYVFDGSRGGYEESSTVNPLNEYGRQKVDLEARLEALPEPRPLVLRLSKVYDLAEDGATLLVDMARRLWRGECLRVATDQVFCPTHVLDVVEILGRLLASSASGIVHLAAEEARTRFDLANEIRSALPGRPGTIEAIRLEDLGEPFRRPKNTTLACRRLREHVDHRFRPLARSIEELVAKHGESRRGRPV